MVALITHTSPSATLKDRRRLLSVATTFKKARRITDQGATTSHCLGQIRKYICPFLFFTLFIFSAINWVRHTDWLSRLGPWLLFWRRGATAIFTTSAAVATVSRVRFWGPISSSSWAYAKILARRMDGTGFAHKPGVDTGWGSWGSSGVKLQSKCSGLFLNKIYFIQVLAIFSYLLLNFWWKYEYFGLKIPFLYFFRLSKTDN